MKIELFNNIFQKQKLQDLPCEQLKLVLVVRNDLKMGKGKVAAQVIISLIYGFIYNLKI